jgi:fructose-specific component phosphotransferase system IIB-like protein
MGTPPYITAMGIVMGVIAAKGAVAVCSARGVITSSGVINNVHKLEGRRVVVVDMRSAVIAADTHTWAERVCADAELADLSVALVAGAHNDAALRDFAWCCALKGALRVVFLNLAAAMRWAERQAALDEHLRRRDGAHTVP